MTTNVIRFPDVTRITVVTDENRVFEQYAAFANGVELHLQDGGRTLKVFPNTGPRDKLDE